MANIAIIVAGGSGQRTKSDIPKQFIEINDKPILVYTMESFQRHPQIDAIELVCKDGWQDTVWEYSRQHAITKLKWMVTGGESVQESIRNGVNNLEGKVCDEDTVIIHDGIRPLVEEKVLTDVIDVCKIFGNAVTALPYNEQIFIIDEDDETTTSRYIRRETIRRVSTPQAYKYSKLKWAYEEAFEKGVGISGSAYTNTMMTDLGETLHFASGSDKNIKITTKDDIELFKAYLKLQIGKEREAA